MIPLTPPRSHRHRSVDQPGHGAGASLVMAAIGFAVNDSGIVVPALQLTVLVPWLSVVMLSPSLQKATV